MSGVLHPKLPSHRASEEPEAELETIEPLPSARERDPARAADDEIDPTWVHRHSRIQH